ncbi:MAG: hypothetical protein ACKVII_26755, partial [Planctomycetales bacterium]
PQAGLHLRTRFSESLVSPPNSSDPGIAAEISLDALNDESEYRIHIPMDLYIKPGQRKKNLRGPKPGPAFTTAELIPRVFARTQTSDQ